jgi:hypothetical protein
MAELVLTLFLDSLMALLLVITAVYCWRLNKRIQVLQDSKSERAQVIREFDQSTQRATQSIAEIHEATVRLSENMQHKIDKANYVADDLQFMIEKGNKLTGNAEPMPARSGRGGKPKAAEVKGDSFKGRGEDAAKPRSSGKGSLDAMLKRVRGGEHAPEDAEAIDAEPLRPRRQGARLRSKAEQELFEALKSGGGKG